ncbi:MurR/RpiR family transcriptional regulator [Pseudomonas sp. PD9R]|uniref:MurR/RpiR family transcriptional regulator n=1 Tax=Pseudomonas sp. PD9R TaxID=2853534 RepID=UPI001C47DB4C|nr:MurR/RpiR family transcriptional regulator [Pseudomonas sp. PD9R]MBV6826492.1 MurR/RpiR family transcriptional regulator [Pseudomonas sp. PD9R]
MAVRARSPKNKSDALGPQAAADPTLLRNELERRLEGRRLTPAHRRITQILVQHAADVGYLTSMELAQLANVSQPSVSRFAVALGFPGFQEMRRALRSLTEPSTTANTNTHNANKYQVAAAAEARNLMELSEQLEDMARIREFGSALAGSAPLLVLGLRASAGLATQFAYFAAKIHPDVRLITNGGSISEDQIEQAKEAGATCILSFAMPLYPRETIQALQYARQVGLDLAVVSDPAFPTQGLAPDFSLSTRICSSLVFDSSVSSAFLVTVLLEAMCDAMPDGGEARLEAGDRSSMRRKVFIR